MEISLEALRLREKELSLDAVMIRGRIEELRHIIAEMERRRGGRPRKATAGLTVINEPADTDEHLFPEGDAA